MTIRIACNLILDCCGILILLLFLLPLFIRKQTGGFNRQKMSWLLYSAVIHFFVLVINLAESVCLLASNAEQAAGVCRLLSGVMNILSGIFLLKRKNDILPGFHPREETIVLKHDAA